MAIYINNEQVSKIVSDIGVAVQFVLKRTISFARKINRLESDQVSFFNRINGFLRFLAMSSVHR